MAGDNFFGTRRVIIGSKVEKFKEDKPNEDQRQIEQDYLRPEPILPYTGPNPLGDPISRLTVKLVFPNEERLEQFKRHFKVAKYVEPSVTSIDVLLTLLDELDAGRIVYDRKSKSITYKT